MRFLLTFSGMGVHTSLQPAPVLAEPSSTEGGIGLDPVFQIWSYLWDVDLNGQEAKYYNMTEVKSHDSNMQAQHHLRIKPSWTDGSCVMSYKMLQHGHTAHSCCDL